MLSLLSLTRLNTVFFKEIIMNRYPAIIVLIVVLTGVILFLGTA